MLVDCQTCPVRDVHCADCVVTALTAIPVLWADGSPDQPFDVVDHAGRSGGQGDAHRAGTGDVRGTAALDRAERRAVSALLAAGLVTTTAANSARAVLDEDLPVVRPRGARRAV